MPILGVIDSSKSGNLISSDYQFIASTTIATATTGYTFSSLTTSFKHLQLRASIRSTTADLGVGIRFNGDTTASNYAWQRMYGVGSMGSDSGSDSYAMQVAGSADNSNLFGYALIDIPNYQNTNMFKSLRSFTGYYGTAYTAAFLLANIWKNANAITSVTVTCASQGGSGQLAVGTVLSLYGLV
jgi:hypothetical protein